MDLVIGDDLISGYADTDLLVEARKAINEVASHADAWSFASALIALDTARSLRRIADSLQTFEERGRP